jgi:hypothetical protein
MLVLLADFTHNSLIKSTISPSRQTLPSLFYSKINPAKRAYCTYVLLKVRKRGTNEVKKRLYVPSNLATSVCSFSYPKHTTLLIITGLIHQIKHNGLN